jgi:hypothetical protein
LCIRDGCFDLIFGNVNDVAVIEAIAESVDVIQPSPAIAFPFDGVSETLKHQRTVAVGSSKTIARGLEGYAGEPECGSLGGRESSSQRIAFAARVGERLGGPVGEALEGLPIGLSGA